MSDLKETKRVSWLGLYGAIVATIAFGWNVYQYFDSRPRLDVEIIGYGELLGVGKDSLVSDVPGLSFTSSNPVIRFINKGSKPLTIYFMQIDFLTDSIPKELPQLPTYINVVGEPMKLDAGDEKDWKPVLINPATVVNKNTKVVKVAGRLRLVAMTTSGKYEKQTRLTLAYPVVP
jgi:hypothetical protein